jgi:hypothetical protein
MVNIDADREKDIRLRPNTRDHMAKHLHDFLISNRDRDRRVGGFLDGASSGRRQEVAGRLRQMMDGKAGQR